LKHIHNKNQKKYKKNKININLCVSLNNRYVYSILISIESVLFNCNKKKSFITYHILCTPDVTDNTLFILKSLIYQYPLNLEIIFYNMGNNFMNYNNPKLSQAAYYRLLSPIIFDLNRIIYLDGDTLTFKDLNEMYQIELKDNYVYGILDFFAYGIDYLGIKSEKYINDGVIILNLEAIRKDKKIYDLINSIESKMILNNQDQTLINFVFYPKIGIIPSKYVIFNHFDESDVEVYSKKLRTKINISEIIQSLKEPTIVHTCLCWPKIWSFNSKLQESFSNCKYRNNCSCQKYHNLYYYYAKKTKYYKNIINFNKIKR
jgi:lipopolysaccharide biosynthesis glycosyltransferase